MHGRRAFRSPKLIIKTITHSVLNSIYATDNFQLIFCISFVHPTQDVIFMIYWIVRVRFNPSLFT